MTHENRNNAPPLRVLIESPYAAPTVEEVETHVLYLRRCLRHSLGLGEAPFASHGFYPQVLDDRDPEQRRQGMAAGFAWGQTAQLVAVYVDHGMTPGMREGIDRAVANGTRVVYRSIGLRGALRVGFEVPYSTQEEHP